MDKKLTLKQIRVLQDMTQDEFAKKYGITKQTLSKLENGHTRAMKAELLLKICLDYGIDPRNVKL